MRRYPTVFMSTTTKILSFVLYAERLFFADARLLHVKENRLIFHLTGIAMSLVVFEV